VVVCVVDIFGLNVGILLVEWLELRLVVDEVRDLRGVPATFRLEVEPDRLVLIPASFNRLDRVGEYNLDVTEMARAPVPLTVPGEGLTGAEAFRREEDRWTPED